MELTKERLQYISVKKENKLWKWVAENHIFSVVIVFTMLFSIINIMLIMNFFKILSNF